MENFTPFCQFSVCDGTHKKIRLKHQSPTPNRKRCEAIVKWKLKRGKEGSQPLPVVTMGRLNFPLWFPFLSFPCCIKTNLSYFLVFKMLRSKKNIDLMIYCVWNDTAGFPKQSAKGSKSAKLENPYGPYACGSLCSEQDLLLSFFLILYFTIYPIQLH